MLMLREGRERDFVVESVRDCEKRVWREVAVIGEDVAVAGVL
jgi:hypothetical protein